MLHQRVVTDRSSPPMHSRYLTNTSTPNTSPKHTPLHTHTHTIYISIHPSTRGHSCIATTTTTPPAAAPPPTPIAARRYSTCYTDTSIPPSIQPTIHTTGHSCIATNTTNPLRRATTDTYSPQRDTLHVIPTYYYLPLTTDLPRRSTSHLTTPPSTYHFRPPDSVTRHTTIYYCIALVWTTPASTSNTFTIHSQHTSS